MFVLQASPSSELPVLLLNKRITAHRFLPKNMPSILRTRLFNVDPADHKAKNPLDETDSTTPKNSLVARYSLAKLFQSVQRMSKFADMASLPNHPLRMFLICYQQSISGFLSSGRSNYIEEFKGNAIYNDCPLAISGGNKGLFLTRNQAPSSLYQCYSKKKCSLLRGDKIQSRVTQREYLRAE